MGREGSQRRAAGTFKVGSLSFASACWSHRPCSGRGVERRGSAGSAAPMELWQLDVVHGFLLADGSSAKALTGIDDHSRYCVSARLMASERTQSVCDGFNSAMKTYGVPLQVLTDNGKVFTGRFAQPPVEVLFDRICRENGVDHILTQPRSPTTTGKIE